MTLNSVSKLHFFFFFVVRTTILSQLGINPNGLGYLRKSTTYYHAVTEQQTLVFLKKTTEIVIDNISTHNRCECEHFPKRFHLALEYRRAKIQTILRIIQ